MRLDSLDYTGPRYFVLCGVEVFGSSSRHPVWPDLTMLWVQRSKEGVSCKDTCMSKGMLCEPAHFRALNSFGVLRENFNCSSVKSISTKYVLVQNSLIQTLLGVLCKDILVFIY